MKRKFFISLILICGISFYVSAIDSLKYNRLVNTISRVQVPKIKDGCVIFTASGNRYAGIAFEHEKYQHIHSFKKLVQSEFQGKEIEPVLFYIMEIPEGVSELRYRLVIDGLWSTDPSNPNSCFDYVNEMSVSVLKVPLRKEFKTCKLGKNSVKFTYIGETNQNIKIAGTFNNWDPFMYTMTEVEPGRYEINLSLPKGTWFYAYFSGSTQMADNTNHNFVYTADGRVASVITID